jgi:LacI family transcriptional regulator
MVATETTQRILRAAEELGYRPNSIARGLKTRLSHTVGVLIPNLTDPVFPPIVRGIEDVLAEAGYTPLTVNTDDDPARGSRALESLLQHQVDGIIAATARRGDPVVRDARRGHTPLVLVLRGTSVAGVSWVCPDERRSATIAVDHLVELGHTKIAHVAGPQDIWNGSERLAGFRDALARHKIARDDGLIVTASRFNFHPGRVACEELLERRRDFTAVVAGSDLIAIGCIDAFAARGLACPDEVSVVGVDDVPLSDHLAPPLTTVRLPQHDLGSRAARMLLDRVSAPNTRTRRVLLAPDLVVRGSTAPPRPGSAKRAGKR